MVKRVVIAGLLLVAFVATGGGCQGPDEYFRSTNGGSLGATGGMPATGGTSPTGTGGTGTGGIAVTGTGGTSTGGTPATGGSTATGGRGTGGVTATGGVIGSGGVTSTGGVQATGGAVGSGGTAGGAAGSHGTGGTAGTYGAGGSAGTTGQGGLGGAVNCIDSIRQMGYAFSPAAPCSMCKDNSTDLSAKCESMIDCMEKSYPCTGNCETNCLNMAGGSGVVSTCVNALVGAACP
ncbi:MAG TPA: hypothetical protein VMT03_14845 [Polyangia bacterium]|nr:hypothetical protein [Polyangia bacterium]